MSSDILMRPLVLLFVVSVGVAGCGAAVGSAARFASFDERRGLAQIVLESHLDRSRGAKPSLCLVYAQRDQWEQLELANDPWRRSVRSLVVNPGTYELLVSTCSSAFNTSVHALTLRVDRGDGYRVVITEYFSTQEGTAMFIGAVSKSRPGEIVQGKVVFEHEDNPQ